MSSTLKIFFFFPICELWNWTIEKRMKFSIIPPKWEYEAMTKFTMWVAL